MKSDRILVVGAHVGDADVMAGALAAHFSRHGGEITFLHLTYGERGNPRVPPEKYRIQKMAEAEESAKKLGVKVMFMGLEDGNLSVSNELSRRIAMIIRKLRPSTVITHWMGSTHQDHAAAHYLTLNAVEYAASQTLEGEPHKVGEVYFAENVEDPYFFFPTVFVDVSDVFDVYMDALKVHEYIRQSAYGINFLQYYEGILRSRGASVGLKFASALAERPARRIIRNRNGLSEGSPYPSRGPA
ncbi:MAG: PIG-L deacetylase family protein [Thermoprotei archaeon]|jgi:LmbE family N-acetylglucosaminyl deacetylase